MTQARKIQLPDCWLQRLQSEFDQPYMQELRAFLIQEQKHHQLYPPMSQVFNAFHLTPFDQVKVVILGQDPYHGANQAHGLAFSVQPGQTPPPSLMNIFQELKNDLHTDRLPMNGDLSHWAKMGVFLLNSILTVRANQALSHANHGWERFTSQVISLIQREKTGIVFILWGAKAQAMIPLIDQQKHFIIKSPHPSPYSADRGFFGSKPFSQTNQYLINQGQSPINWI
jgi:uracil-DNA glycosylase